MIKEFSTPLCDGVEDARMTSVSREREGERLGGMKIS